MRQYLDKELQGHAMIFDGPMEILDESIRANKAMGPIKIVSASFPMNPNSTWNNPRFKNWEACRAHFTTSTEDTKIVQEMVDQMKRDMPVPESIKRRPGWRSNGGTINIPRALKGEREIFRGAKRQWTHGITNIALLCNLDAIFTSTPRDLFWRGAAAIAVADILEDAGYNVEIWMWNHGYYVYPQPNHHQFTTCQLKEAGAAIDMNAMAHALSIWFLRLGVFGSFATCKSKPLSVGGMCYDLGEWRKYMDVTDGVKEYRMPIVKRQAQAMTEAKRILDEVSEQRYYIQ